VAAVANYLVVRQSPNWRRFDLNATKTFLRAISWPEHIILNFADAWNAELSMSFLEFRARVKEIAIDNWLSVKDARCVFSDQWISAGNAGFENILKPNDLVAFTDDDDWFNPCIFEVLREFDLAGGFCWDHVHFGLVEVDVPGQRLRDSVWQRRSATPPVLFTNNYAVSGAVIKRLGVPAVLEHYHAQDRVREGDILLVHAPMYLSASHKHPCSTTAIYLHRDSLVLSAPEVARPNVRSYVGRLRDQVSETVLDFESEWARPWIRQVEGLLDQVLARPSWQGGSRIQHLKVASSLRRPPQDSTLQDPASGIVSNDDG
jgi:hypothetical protein